MNDETRDRELQERLLELPRSIEPSRDLWPSVRARIESRKVVDADFATRRPRSWVYRHGLLAAAATLLVVVTAATTAWWMRSAPMPGGLAPSADIAVVPAGWSEFTAAEDAYQRVTDELLAKLAERRDQLSPETVQIVESNLDLIEHAIQQARAALERDPGNAGLATKVTDIYRRRVDFLRQLNRL